MIRRPKKEREYKPITRNNRNKISNDPTSTIWSGILNGFSFGAGSHLAHVGLDKILHNSSNNTSNSTSNEMCKKIENEYKKCIMDMDNCKKIGLLYKELCEST